jgi:hypothetical protein
LRGARSLYFGREDLLRALPVPKDMHHLISTISILRRYSDNGVLASDGIDKVLILAAIARLAHGQQRQILQHLSLKLDAINMGARYYDSDSVTFVVRHGCLELKRLVQKLIQASGCGTNIMLNSFRGQLHEATFWSLLEMTGASIARVASVVGLSSPDTTGHSNVVKLLPLHGRLLTPLVAAALRQGRPHIFRAFSSDLDYSYRDNAGNSFLHIAVAFNSDSACFRVVLQHGLDPNCRNRDGDTPLHALMACRDWADILECTKALVAAGADCSATNKNGDPAICAANHDVLDRLYSSGEVPQLFEPQILSVAFQQFLKHRNLSCISLLVDWEVPAPLLPDGTSILHVLKYADNELVTKVLLRYPHLINAEALNGDTPLKCAMGASCAEIIFKHGGRYSKDDVAYEKLLSATIEAGNSELLDLLLDHPFVDSISPAAMKKSLLIATAHRSYFNANSCNVGHVSLTLFGFSSCC